MSPEATSRARWAAVVLACVAQFMVILDVSVVNVALPSIRHSSASPAPASSGS